MTEQTGERTEVLQDLPEAHPGEASAVDQKPDSAPVAPPDAVALQDVVPQHAVAPQDPGMPQDAAVPKDAVASQDAVLSVCAAAPPDAVVPPNTVAPQAELPTVSADASENSAAPQALAICLSQLGRLDGRRCNLLHTLGPAEMARL